MYQKEEMGSAFAAVGLGGQIMQNMQEPNFTRDMTKETQKRYKSVERRKNSFAGVTSYTKLSGPQDNFYNNKRI